MVNLNKERVRSIAEICSEFSLQLPATIHSYVNGSSAGAADDDSHQIAIRYPATEEVLYQLVETDDLTVDEAVAVARKTFDQSGWADLAHDERKKILSRIRDAIAAHSEELAVLQCLEVGIPISGLKAMHMPRTVENFDFFLAVSETLSGETYQQLGNFLSVVTKEPVGVTALIAPWNAPLVLLSMKLSAALALGNTCVIKASEQAPYSVLRFVEIMHEAGLPAGVVNLVNGRGETTGKRLVENPDVDVVGFVGGTETGTRIMTSAAKTLKKVGLELGGKSANIVFSSANIDNAIDGSLLAILSNNGQQCLAGSRIFVQRAIANEFIKQFTERMAAIKIGDPFDPSTELGPMAFRAHKEKVLSYVDISKQEGGKILNGGETCSDFESGYFIEPTAVLVEDHSNRVCQEEIFGPFVTIMIFDTTDEVVTLANSSDFGLVSYIWSDDLPTVMKVSGAIKAGTVWVNTPLTRDLRAPFGGYKQSGIGRDGLHGCVELFTEEKTTMLPTKDLSFPRMGMTKSS